MTTAYVDASALSKLILDEPHSKALRRWWIESERAHTSQIGIVETQRAVARWDAAVDIRWTLRQVSVIHLDQAIAHRAATLHPPALRTLDAIHVASALALGQELDAFVTYDDRLAEAAQALGLPVVRPA